MVFGFDPRKLVKDEQDKEKKKVEEVVSAQEKYDLELERREARLRKKSQIRGALDDAFKIIRETKFRIKEGDDAYYDYKKRSDPTYKDPREYAEGQVFITSSESNPLETSLFSNSDIEGGIIKIDMSSFIEFLIRSKP